MGLGAGSGVAARGCASRVLRGTVRPSGATCDRGRSLKGATGGVPEVVGVLEVVGVPDAMGVPEVVGVPDAMGTADIEAATAEAKPGP